MPFISIQSTFNRPPTMVGDPPVLIATSITDILAPNGMYNTLTWSLPIPLPSGYVVNHYEVYRTVDNWTSSMLVYTGMANTYDDINVTFEINYTYTVRLFATPTLPAPTYLESNEASTGITYVISTYAGSNSVGGFAGDGGLATLARFNVVYGVAYDYTTRDVYVSDGVNRRIRKIDGTTKIISTICGNGTNGSSGDTGLAINATISNPRGLCISNGYLYFADDGNHKVRRIHLTTGIITLVAGTTIGNSGNGGNATAAQLNGPKDVAVDSDGNVYITDSANNRVRRVDGITNIITNFAGNGLGGETFVSGSVATATGIGSVIGITVDTTGTVYINDQIYDIVAVISGGIITDYTPVKSGTAAVTDAIGPLGIDISINNDVYVCDTANQRRIIRVDGDTATPTIVAGQSPFYQFGFTGDGGSPTAARISSAYGISVGEIYADNKEEFFIADTDNNRIRRVGYSLIP